MLFFIFWVLLAYGVGHLARGRKIGFWSGFLLSILLSPLIGLVIVLLSKDLKKEQYEMQMMQAQVTQAAVLENIAKRADGQGKASLTDELERLQTMKQAGHLTEEEYQVAKGKLFA